MGWAALTCVAFITGASSPAMLRVHGLLPSAEGAANPGSRGAVFPGSLQQTAAHCGVWMRIA